MTNTIDIKTDETKIRVCVVILNNPILTDVQKNRAYAILDELTNISNSSYEKNINLLFDLDKQLAMNTIIKRSVC